MMEELTYLIVLMRNHEWQSSYSISDFPSSYKTLPKNVPMLIADAAAAVLS